MRCLINIFAVFFLVSSLLHAEPTPWFYEMPLGPGIWGTIPGYELCAKGTRQSPIAIETERFGIPRLSENPNRQPLAFDVRPSKLSVRNYGQTIEAVYDPGTTLKFNNDTYNLQQFHFHSPSEHFLDEQQFPMEAHFVFATAQTPPRTLVVAFLMKINEWNPILDEILTNAPSQSSMHPIDIQGIEVDVSPFLHRVGETITYTGSLTTPPCSEEVQWVVSRYHPTVSWRQVRQFQSLLAGPNNRPVQPVNGRVILLNLWR